MMRRVMRSIGMVLSAAVALGSAAWGKPSGDPAKLTRELAEQRLVVYMSAINGDLSPNVQSALDRIPDLAKKLLAIKYYLQRSREEIDRKWAWTGKYAKFYRSTGEYRRALDEIGKVKRAFAEMNPGYSLDVRIEIRSLGSQIGKWNTTRSVAKGADEIFTSFLSLVTDSAVTFNPEPDEESLERFKLFLLAFKPVQSPTVAVPGLSQHGQFRAFDFKIMRGRRVIAGTSTARIAADWDAPGWTERLREAICRASDRFEGPLDDPYEPWHYAYTPW